MRGMNRWDRACYYHPFGMWLAVTLSLNMLFWGLVMIIIGVGS